MITAKLEKIPVLKAEVTKPYQGKGYAEGYEVGHAQGYTEGEQTAKAAAEAHNAEILADCNSVLPTKGASTAETLEQVPQRIGEIDAEGGALWQYVTNLDRTFTCAEWDGDKVFEVNVPNISNGITYFIQDIKGIKKLKLKGNTANNALIIAYPFYNATIEEIDLTEFGAGGLKFKTFKGLAYGCSNLKYIYGELDCSVMTGNIDVPFTYASTLIEVRFKAETVSKSLDISPTSRLSAASVQSILEALVDLTGTTAQTLTFHRTVFDKLTDAQKAIATAKNWTLVRF